jgi:hypothetical protein
VGHLCFLNHQSFCFEEEERTEYGAIYFPLREYEVLTWVRETNIFLFLCGEHTVTLLDMLLILGLPFFEIILVPKWPYQIDHLPSINMLDPSKFLFPNFQILLFI